MFAGNDNILFKPGKVAKFGRNGNPTLLVRLNLNHTAEKKHVVVQMCIRDSSGAVYFLLPDGRCF